MSYIGIAYPCGCKTNDRFTLERMMCEHKNIYHRKQTLSQGLIDLLESSD